MLRFPDTTAVRRLFTNDEITDLLFVVSYDATLPTDGT
jgi:hypothetical protein